MVVKYKTAYGQRNAPFSRTARKESSFFFSNHLFLSTLFIKMAHSQCRPNSIQKKKSFFMSKRQSCDALPLIRHSPALLASQRKRSVQTERKCEATVSFSLFFVCWLSSISVDSAICTSHLPFCLSFCFKKKSSTVFSSFCLWHNAVTHTRTKSVKG